MEQEDTTPININITESIASKHVSYNIKGEDRIGQFEALRRYNDFHVLRLTLLQRWPGCYVPPIPAKQALGNNEQKVVEDRKRFLQYFLEQVAKLRHIYFSDEFQTFLRTKNTDMEKALQGLPKQSIQEVYEKFKKNFPHLNGREVNSDLILKVSSFSTYLNKTTKQLESLKEQVKLLAAAKKQYTDQFNIMTQTIVPEYEKNILIEYVNHKTENLIFTNHNDVNVTAREIKDQNAQTNNYDYLVDLLRIECREVEAFQETLKQKEFVDNLKASAQQKLRDQNSELVKLQAGKTTLKSMFSKGSNTEQAQTLEKKIQDTQNEIKLLEDLCIMITSILCFDEIDRFKKNKQNKYYEILIKVSQLEQQLNQLYIKFWSEVSKGTEAEVVV
ncbi:unnamed protein product [Paramecium octaurelia]|uniref:PX domain-containing protein n=1 Tax=Paramecium octaurelia TaxID=43137 RepID=A0A8S1WKQ2_PAROT|nr:unnamed protein product [Paramecium octaurelia]